MSLEKLKAGLKEDARQSTVPELWRGIAMHGYANQLPYMIGRIRDYRSEDPESRDHGRKYLEKCRQDYGLSSIEDLITAIVQLREELHGQLSSEDFSAYFGRSLDVR